MAGIIGNDNWSKKLSENPEYFYLIAQMSPSRFKGVLTFKDLVFGQEKPCYLPASTLKNLNTCIKKRKNWRIEWKKVDHTLRQKPKRNKNKPDCVNLNIPIYYFASTWNWPPLLLLPLYLYLSTKHHFHLLIYLMYSIQQPTSKLFIDWNILSVTMYWNHFY